MRGDGTLEGPQLVGQKTPEQHDAGRDQLRRKIGQPEPAGEGVHESPGQEKAHPGDERESPGRLGVRAVAAIGESPIERIRRAAARHIADERRRDRIDAPGLDKPDQQSIVNNGGQQADAEKGGELAGERRKRTIDDTDAPSALQGGALHACNLPAILRVRNRGAMCCAPHAPNRLARPGMTMAFPASYPSTPMRATSAAGMAANASARVIFIPARGWNSVATGP